MTHARIQKMCAAALLCAIGILIPMISPVKISIGPMSFTLASHVALFLAMFISPSVAAVVTVGTTLGFLLAGFPPVVVGRAASQIVFVMIGAYLLCKKPDAFNKPVRIFTLGVFLSVIHAVFEMLVVTGFYFAGVPLKGTVLGVIFGLVGAGTFVHSMIDLGIALVIWIPVSHAIRIPVAFTLSEKRKI
ncbi:MAG: hypothetical protein RSD78_07410 [Oscillospiraceae bacterium]